MLWLNQIIIGGVFCNFEISSPLYQFIIIPLKLRNFWPALHFIINTPLVVLSSILEIKSKRIRSRGLNRIKILHYDDWILKSIVFKRFIWLIFLPKMTLNFMQTCGNIALACLLPPNLVTLFLPQNSRGYITNISIHHFIMTHPKSVIRNLKCYKISKFHMRMTWKVGDIGKYLIISLRLAKYSLLLGAREKSSASFLTSP